MIKRILVHVENFFYKVIIRNLLKTSKLGYGLVVTGAEAGTNFERIYDNQPEGSFVIGHFIDKALLNLPAVQATRGRKEDIKKILENEIHNNILLNYKTRILDLASGASRYLREFSQEHRMGYVESVCIDKDMPSVRLGRVLARKENLKNIKFFKADLFDLKHLKAFAAKLKWKPNIIIASGLFIYFSNEIVEKILKDIYEYLPTGGIIIFTSYEQLNTRKLMRKAMSTSTGQEWTLYYRQPEQWRSMLHRIGFKNNLILRDQWQMNNICTARK